jgi:hypothetical protein
MAANYPDDPSPQYKASARQYFYSLRHLLPCTVCQKHYTSLLSRNQPRVESSLEMQEWVLWLHNEVTQKVSSVQQQVWNMEQIKNTYHRVDESTSHSHLVEDTENKNLTSTIVVSNYYQLPQPTDQNMVDSKSDIVIYDSTPPTQTQTQTSSSPFTTFQISTMQNSSNPPTQPTQPIYLNQSNQHNQLKNIENLSKLNAIKNMKNINPSTQFGNRTEIKTKNNNVFNIPILYTDKSPLMSNNSNNTELNNQSKLHLTRKNKYPSKLYMNDFSSKPFGIHAAKNTDINNFPKSLNNNGIQQNNNILTSPIKGLRSKLSGKKKSLTSSTSTTSSTPSQKPCNARNKQGCGSQVKDSKTGIVKKKSCGCGK